MHLVIITGAPAAGKMTVGKALARLTGFRLLHNHLSIELVHRFFDFGTPEFRRLDKTIRFALFREIAASDLPGLIFTLVWAYDDPEDATYVDEILAIFRERGTTVSFVELRADLEERLIRNRHPDRLAEKATKRDLERSELNLRNDEAALRMELAEGEFPEKAFLRIDNTRLTPAAAANEICRHFSLPRISER